MTLEQRRIKSVMNLLSAVRKNRPMETKLLEYLEDYCMSAWRLGWEARDRDAKRDAKARKPLRPPLARA